MEPDGKKKFNFGTGEIDVDQWLQDIDAGLNAYYSDIDKTYHKEEAQAVRNAMTNLIGRISNGDMMSRSANGTYNFKSQLYSPEKGKYDKWAHLIALGYIGNKGRALISSPKLELTKQLNTKTKYTPLTLILRLNNSILRGAVNLDLDNTWWGSASTELKAKHLTDFLDKEATYLRGTDVEDVDDAYKDLGKEGLASAMSALASQISSNPNGDYGRQFGNLGITNLLRPPVTKQLETKVKTVDELLLDYLNAEITKQKQILLGWYLNRGLDTYYNNGYDLYLPALLALTKVHNDRASGDDVKAIIKQRSINPSKIGGDTIGTVIGDVARANLNYKNHFTENVNTAKEFISRLQLNWETLFTSLNKTLQYKDEKGNTFEYSPQKLWEGLALLTHQMKDNEGNMGYTYLDNPRNYPISVGNLLYYIPGTYKQNGDILLIDTYNNRLVKSSITKYPDLLKTLGSALYEKEGGILKYLEGNTIVSNYDRFGVKPQLSSSLSLLTAEQKPVLQDNTPPEIGSGNYALIASLLGDITSLGLASSKNPVAKKASRYTNVISGIIGAAGEVMNKTASWNTAIDLSSRVLAASPRGNIFRAALTRSVLNKLTDFVYANSGLISYTIHEAGSDSTPMKAAFRKVLNGLVSLMNSNDWVYITRALSILAGTGASNYLRADHDLKSKTTTNLHALDTKGNIVLVTALQVRDLRGKKNPTITIKDGLVNNELTPKVELQTKSATPTSIFKPRATAYKVATYPYLTGSDVSESRMSNWDPGWWFAGRTTKSEFLNLKNIAERLPDGIFYPFAVPRTRRQNDLGEQQLRPRRENDLEDQVNTQLQSTQVSESAKPEILVSSRPEVKPSALPQLKHKNKKKRRKHELGGYFTFLRTGGIIKYEEGGTTGVNNGTGYNWYNNVFSGYKQHILDGLSNSNYVLWLNSMQGQHAQIYKAAGGATGSWKNNYYKDASVKNYLESYLNGFSNYDTGNPYNTFGIGKAFNTNGHYDFSASSDRGKLEVNNGLFVGNPDGLYSQMTDDRRLLGREGDWTDTLLKEWNTALQARGYKMDLDPNDHYYRINPIDNSAQNATGNKKDPEAEKVKNDDVVDREKELQKQAIPQPELKKPFDPRALLIAGRAATNIFANNWIFDRMLDRQPLWYSKDFIDRKLDTIGDYAALANAGNQAADLRTIQQLRLVSDQSLNLAADFEAGRVGRDIWDKARLQDAAKQAATHEAALQVDIKDLEDNRDTAFLNRQLMHNYLTDRFNLYNAKDKAIVDATIGMTDNLSNLYAGKYLEKKAAYDEAKKNMLETPREYALNKIQSLYPELYSKIYNKTYSSEDLAQFNKLMAEYSKLGRNLYYMDYYTLYGGLVELPKKLHGVVDNTKANNTVDKLKLLRDNQKNKYISAARADIYGITMKDLLEAGYVWDGLNGYIYEPLVSSDKKGGKLEFIKSLRQ